MSTSATSALGDLSANYRLPAARQAANELGQEQFLLLMLTQFRNQDPLKPQDPSELLTQLAQVTSVAGISEMSQSMASLADSLYAGQALQAATVVGRSVLAPAGSLHLAAGASVRGAVDLPVATTGGYVRVVDANGLLVREIPLGARGAGLATFDWDGRDGAGEPVAAGSYQVLAGYRSGAGEEAADVYLARRVTSVSIGGNGRRPEITTEDGARVGLADIRAIY